VYFVSHVLVKSKITAQSLLLMITILSLHGIEATAQSLANLPSGIDAGMVQDYLQKQKQASSDDATSLQQGLDTRVQQTVPEVAGQNQQHANAGSSRIEVDYEKRTGTKLTQYGYRAFSGRQVGAGKVFGAIQDRYRLDIGDEIVVTFHGQQSQTLSTRVDREGRVVIPHLKPIPAAGRSFAQFRDELESRVSASMIGTEVFVSVGKIRSFPVLLMGEVFSPGPHYVTGLSTLLDAIYAGGGIKKTGSLRKIKLVRAGKTYHFDLYDLLLGGDADIDLGLVDGDRIIVPPIGHTVAVTGMVKTPGIYEIAPSESFIGKDRLLHWAGGTLRTTGNRYLRFSLDKLGRERVAELGSRKDRLSSGDILQIVADEVSNVGAVEIHGHVRTKGVRSVNDVQSLGRFLRQEDALLSTPYLPFAAVLRTNLKNYTQAFIGLDLGKILRGEQNFLLQERDELIIFSIEDIDYLLSDAVQKVLSLGVSAPNALLGTCEGLKEFSRLARTIEYQWLNLGNQKQLADDATSAGKQDRCPALFDKYPRLITFLLDNAILVSGQVRRPGIYPVATNVALDDLIAVAGGLTRSADTSRIELSWEQLEPEKGAATLMRERIDLAKATGFTLQPGQIVRFTPYVTNKEGGVVVLSGAFKRPGRYDIARGERLSQVIERAGGLMPDAYPYGAVFQRERVRQQQEAQFRQVAQQLQKTIATQMVSADATDKPSSATLTAANLIEQLSSVEAVGRVVIEADPTVLQVHPEKDMILEAGDAIFMPRRMNTVSVAGEVLNPGTVIFEPGLQADDYINMAGGLQEYADDERIFVVLPNGIAQPLSVSMWNYRSELIPPASTVVVPIDADPLDWMGLTKGVTSILSNLAITAASLAAIN
jgi:polysaccharide export outer membrane protein